MSYTSGKGVFSSGRPTSKTLTGSTIYDRVMPGINAAKKIINDSYKNSFAPPALSDSAHDRLADLAENVSAGIEEAKKHLPQNNPDISAPAGPSAPAPGGSADGTSGATAPSSASNLDYLYADLAKHYGMDSSTAYAEAMANTAYSRAVDDLKRAGLNPALLVQSSFVEPANTVYGSPAQEDSSGSGAGAGVRSSGKSQSDSLLGNADLMQGVASVLAACGAMAVSRNPYVALVSAQIAGTSAKYLSKGLAKFKKR
nr:pilot protein for DNA ejection [Microvirus sp.]